MTPARRLTVALVGLIALVVIGYFAKDVGSSSPPAPPPSTSTQAARPAAEVPGASSGLPVEPLSTLPAEARTTWELIGRGGPFPFPRNDGTTFQNREKRLPAKSGEYYREYTVPTPGSDDRGARRLVTGREREVFYTTDHYGSFVVVDVTR